MAGAGQVEASSSVAGSSTYDVFLNFKGEDTCRDFIDNLYIALNRERINVFMGSDILQVGEEIDTELVEAIQGSKIFIPIFSEGYANSKWCLMILEKIMECHKSNGQIVLPIFFDVEQFDVRNQRGRSFTEAFLEHERNCQPQTVKRWRKALSDVGKIRGWVLNQIDHGDESTLVQRVVEKVLKETCSIKLSEVEYPVGLDSQVIDIGSLLNIGSNDVRFVGICGRSGIGKTTIAKALYNHFVGSFPHNCFLENIGEASRGSKRLVSLQEKLIYGITKRKVAGEILLVDRGKEVIRNICKGVNVLLVLDDVDDSSQLDALAINLKWLGQGSRVIITTRHEHVLNVVNVDPSCIYRPKELDFGQSLRLFSLHAFKQEEPLEEYKELSRGVVHYSGGLPLTLVKLGSHLSNMRDKEEWEDALKVLRASPHKEVHTKLKISHENLGASSSDTSTSVTGSSTYDVFLNFRGEDTCRGFTGHLYSALNRERINVFRDSHKLQVGEEIGSELMKAIQGSKIFIPIFSKGYGDSKWCLMELEKIMECHKSNGQIVLPIFFDVEPSDVRYQSGRSFKEAFFEHERNSQPERVKCWREALSEVGKMKGWVLNQIENGNQLKLVEKVVDRVFDELDCGRFVDLKYPVGLSDRVEDVLHLLDLDSSDVLFVGICGVGGLGKTAIAEAVFNRVYRKFHKRCFLANIREEASRPKGLESLQEQLLNSVSKKKVHGQIRNVDRGKQVIKERLQGEKILVILDDVDCHSRLDALGIDFNCFGPGSRVIITSRDKHTLKEAVVDESKIYHPRQLDDDQSLQLFSLHAFSHDRPVQDYEMVSHRVSLLAGGLPLTLEVLGSSLFDIRENDVWQSMLRKLIKIPHDDVQQKLKIGYDSLEEDEKSVFLDAACFFVGWRKETVISLWEACDFEPIEIIATLTKKSLLKFKANSSNSYEELWMHDLIQAMGRSIVNEMSPSEPGKRSRLWDEEEILDVLTKNKATQSIEGILPPSNPSYWSVCIHREDFAMMSKLRFLYINGAHSEGDFPHLPSSLTWFSWWGCPLENLPGDFYLKKLVYMNLSNSRIRQAWTNYPKNQVQLFHKLKVLRLRFCDHLSESPHFSWFPHLEMLDLGCCKNMVNLHNSIGDLKSLVKLYLDETKIEQLPSSICRLSSLQFLTLRACSSLQNLPESIGDLVSLVTLSLDGTKIEELPNSICRLSSLRFLTLSCCSSLKSLPESIGDLESLVELSLDGTKIEELPNSICKLSCLQILNLNRCSLLRNLPESIGDLKSLIELSIHGTNITKLPYGVGLLENLESFYTGWEV